MNGTKPALFGAIFGFVLSRAGATDASAIHAMFLLRDLHLAGVIMVAIALSAVGYFFLARHWRGKQPLNLKPKPMQRGLIGGALLFGIGWGLSGTCPGTALAQLGQGTLAASITLLGIVLGTRLHALRTAKIKAPLPAAPDRACDARA